MTRWSTSDVDCFRLLTTGRHGERGGGGGGGEGEVAGRGEVGEEGGGFEGEEA